MKICSVAGCQNKFRAKGLCSTHMNRVYKYGDPLGAAEKKPSHRLSYMTNRMWDECPKWPFSRTSAGYGNVFHEGEVRYVHRIVCAIANGPPPSPEHHAAHNCGKGHEGCFGARCVAWKTPSENMADKVVHGTAQFGESGSRAVLTEERVLEIRRIGNSEPQSLVALRYGVSRATIGDILRRKSWAFLDHQFRKEQI